MLPSEELPLLALRAGVVERTPERVAAWDEAMNPGGDGVFNLYKEIDTAIQERLDAR
jgi:hypothetical protein